MIIAVEAKEWMVNKMAEYIDRQAALNAINIEREYMTRRQEWGAEHILTHYGYRIIADMPSADVEPVVRCKDCANWNRETHGCLRNPSVSPWWEDDFCNYGARMDGEQDG